ncbi:hypothetical protein E2C01_049095 [Portunus trituberculatus]|uniref:Uncharacterized protein n=1 Tax=Portunus trituberculatus TaxID=210409 RepID=A0A5B7GF49_PORTR|nr:hypothetical protein [Portunus trituberculatus]
MNGHSVTTGNSSMARTPCMPGMMCIYHTRMFKF